MELKPVAAKPDIHAAAGVLDVRGGLFCDDPGLGKTVTGLALVLKVRGPFTAAAWTGRVWPEARGAVKPSPRAASPQSVLGREGPREGWGARSRRLSCPARVARVQTLGTVASPPAGVVPIYGHGGSRHGFYKLTPNPNKLTPQPPTSTPNAATPPPGAEPSPSLVQALFGSDDGTDTVERTPPAVRSRLAEVCGASEAEAGEGAESPTRLGAKRKADELDAEESQASNLTAGAEENWLECDVCGKWRKLPPGHHVDLERHWWCGDHPEEQFASCQVPDTWAAEYGARKDMRLSAAAGYVPLQNKVR